MSNKIKKAYEVIFSFATEDKQVVDDISLQLEQLNITHYAYKHNDNIGESYRELTKRLYRRSRSIIVILHSENSQKTNVQEEHTQIIGHHHKIKRWDRVFVVKMNLSIPNLSGLPVDLIHYDWVEGSADNPSQIASKLLTKVEDLRKVKRWLKLVNFIFLVVLAALTFIAVAFFFKDGDEMAINERPIEEQKPEIRYYDSTWVETTENRATFRRLIYPSNDTIHNVEDYYMSTNNLQFAGKMSDIERETLEGYCSIYYENGLLQYTGAFVGGEPEGTFDIWDEQGGLIMSGIMESDDESISGIITFYRPNGSKKVTLTAEQDEIVDNVLYYDTVDNLVLVTNPNNTIKTYFYADGTKRTYVNDSTQNLLHWNNNGILRLRAHRDAGLNEASLQSTGFDNGAMSFYQNEGELITKITFKGDDIESSYNPENQVKKMMLGRQINTIHEEVSISIEQMDSIVSNIGYDMLSIAGKLLESDYKRGISKSLH